MRSMAWLSCAVSLSSCTCHFQVEQTVRRSTLYMFIQIAPQVCENLPVWSQHQLFSSIFQFYGKMCRPLFCQAGKGNHGSNSAPSKLETDFRSPAAGRGPRTLAAACTTSKALKHFGCLWPKDHPCTEWVVFLNSSADQTNDLISEWSPAKAARNMARTHGPSGTS